MKEMVGGCCVCSDERGWAENPLVYCDGAGCTVAVHQACYGIVTVPTGPWFCRKCESQERSARVRCELCPIKDGALKRTDTQAWAHVVCALYIPEVRFGNVTTMEPIILQLIPQERYNKPCYICEEQGKGSRAMVGACMQCNKSGCKVQFHVTCAQALGLLCEEAGNYTDNVKYCGYCQHHYSKLKKGGNVKQIPPYKSVSNESPDEREEGGRKRKSQGGKGGGRGRNATPSPNLNKPGGLSPSPGSESGDHSRASTPAGPNGNATKELLPPPGATSSIIIKDSKDKDKNEDGKEKEKKDKEKGKDLVNSSVSSSASTAAKFTTSNFVETVVTPSESVFGTDGSKSAGPISGSGTTKKRRNAGGVRTPPTSTPSQDKDTKDKDKETSDNTATSATSATATSSPSTPASSILNPPVTKMEVDKSPPSTASQDAVAVEKGVKKLKIVAEPNLSSLGSNSSNSESVTSKGPQSTSSSPGPVGSSVSSSANSIVVSVPLTAAVSLPNAPGQQAFSMGNNSAASVASTVPTAAAPEAQPQQITSSSSSSNSSSNSSSTSSLNKAGTSDTHGKRSRSFSSDKPEKVEKQDKRKLKRGGGGQQQLQLHVGTSAPSTPISPALVPSPTITPSHTPSPAPTPPSGSSSSGTSTSSSTSAIVSPASLPPISSTTPIPLPLNSPISPALTPAPLISPVSSTSSTPSVPTPLSPVPGRRGRPSSTPAPAPAHITSPPTIQQTTPQPYGVPSDIFSSSNISMKESPPSSPETVTHRGRPKGRRGHQANNSSNASNHKEDRDVKIFQNGVTSINNAPHMLGNQLNPASSMAQKMSDTLSAELEAHSIFSSEPNLSNQNNANIVGPQLPSRVLAAARGQESRPTLGSGAMPQTLDQLLERQWEQGSQFLMEQAQHFDIASLLTCLHQLRSENTRLEEHIRKLQARRDHLLAVNARLAIPLTHTQPTSTPPTPPHGTPGPSPGPQMSAQVITQGLAGQSPVPVTLPLPVVPLGPGPQGSPQLAQQQQTVQLPPQGLNQHLSHSQSHPPNHSQNHPPHPQSLPQSQLPQSHQPPIPHPQGHGQMHPQSHQGHSQGHPQGHPQGLLQNSQSQQSRQPSQRAPYLENGLPAESGSIHQGYGTHQRPQPSPTIRHTQSGSNYMMSQTPPTSNTSVVRSPVSSDPGRRGVGVSGPIVGSQGYPMPVYPQGSAISMPIPPQQVVIHHDLEIHRTMIAKQS